MLSEFVFASPSARSQRRAGRSFALPLAAILLVGAISSAAVFHRIRRDDTDSEELLTTTVWRGPYDHSVVAKGTVQSASNTEVKCEVRSRGGGTPILDVVPEGTFVEKGDTLVELDDSLLQEEQDLQQILVSTRQSLLAQAENTLKAAEMAKVEYDQGLYVTLEKQLQSELFVAQQAKSDAEESLESTKVLFGKAVATATQVEAAYASLDEATNRFDSAQTNLNTLRKLTRQKELTILDAAIASAQVELKTQQRNLQLEQRRLQQIKNQIAKCTIEAPAAGQVVYVNEPEYYRSSTYAPFVMAPGATVREQQTIIWLPNMSDMQVTVSIHEAHVASIRPGLPVSIRVEAYADEMFEGEVTSISQFPEPSNFWSNSANKYAAKIRIKNPSPDLRVGMNAEARIHVVQIPDALQLPVQALAESDGRFFSLVRNDDDYETRELSIDSINDQVAAIESGIGEGDEVVLHPRSANGLLQLPDFDHPTPVASDASNSTSTNASHSPTLFGTAN